MTQRLPEPTKCDACKSSDIAFIPNDELYGELLGVWPYVWHCRKCCACVGCHKGTKSPLGRMAGKQTRRLRTKAHKVFDPIWKMNLLTRSEAYDWLATKLGIEPDQCHISWLTDAQLKETALQSEAYFSSRMIEVKRKAKKDAKRAKYVRGEIEKFKRRKATGRPRCARRTCPY